MFLARLRLRGLTRGLSLMDDCRWVIVSLTVLIESESINVVVAKLLGML